MTVSAAETDDFEIMYERCYEQTIGAKPGEALDTSNEYVAAFVQNVDKTANENWVSALFRPTLFLSPNRTRLFSTTTAFVTKKDSFRTYHFIGSEGFDNHAHLFIHIAYLNGPSRGDFNHCDRTCVPCNYKTQA